MALPGRSVATFLILLSVAGCATVRSANPRTPSADPSFDWFAYEGRDSVFTTVRPGPGEYTNPILQGFYPDPSMTRVGNDYYLVTSTFSYFPGIPVFHSRDMVSWTQIGNVIDRPSQLRFDSLGISRGVFAPTIQHHAGTFYVLNTCVDCGGNYVVTAKDPAGPWSEPVWLRGIGGIDPSLFFDDNGKTYVLNNDAPVGQPLYEGHRAIWIQEFDLTALQGIGPRSVVVNGGIDLSKKPIWIEGPHIFKVDGKYYLSAAEGGTAEGHSQVILRSDSALGPYVPGPVNPFLTQRGLDRKRPFPVTSAGHAQLVRTQNGDWWASFLAVRPYEGDFYNTGRETFLLPVRWENGWPFMTTEAIPYVHARPALPRQPTPRIPMSGNFTVRDEFNRPALAPYWLMIRTPRERWYDLTSNPGSLTIRARREHIGRLAQPSFIGRRQQHARATVSTAMRYLPLRPGDKAGLIAFQNDDFYYFMAATLVDGRPVLQLEKAAGPGQGSNPAVIATAPLDLARGTPLYLKIEAQGDNYDFYYWSRPNKWLLLHRDADARILSTRTAGGFVGTVFGMYAYTDNP